MATTREDRRKAAKQALANAALEGFHPNSEFFDLLARYIAGEISLESALEYTKAQYKQTPDPPRKMSD